MSNTMLINLFSIVLFFFTTTQGRNTLYTSNEVSLTSPTTNDGICKSVVETQGYTCEEHTVTTEDGYILNLQRIPAGRSGKKADKPPVLIQHGLFCDAVIWLFNSPEESLGFILADSGFDVWLINGRGTTYSNNHISLNPNDKDYWDWSWNELASYDIPSSVQYVYNQTGQKIHYVGHSQGTLVAFINLSQGKLVNMLRSTALLSPIAHMNHVSSLATKSAAELFLANDVYWLGLCEFIPNTVIARGLAQNICKILLLNCANLLTFFTGPNCCINATKVDYYLNFEPEPTSTKNLIHLSQMIRTGEIANYDYHNEIENKQHYGTIVPPSYDMTKIPSDFPLFISYGANDYLSDVNDVKLLLNDLKNHDANKLVVLFKKNYAHADFIAAYNAKQEVYDPMIDFFNSH